VLRYCIPLLVIAFTVANRALAESHLMRFADIHQDKIVFTYEGDLWLVTATGGDARRITHDRGEEKYAKFSPDGARIAFTASYDGGTDVYVMDASGGVPKRLTYHPAADNVLDWFPDGQHVLFRSRRTYPDRADQIYKISIDGGMPERLPVDRAGLTAISPDGKSIAYNRISTEFRTWKRYVGGMAPAIWMGSLKQMDYQTITDWKGTNSWPMWGPDGIYFVSDREAGTLNLCRYDPASRKTSIITHYKDYDVKYPSLGPGAIVYQYSETLYVLDLASGQSRMVNANIPSDLVNMRPWYVDATKDQGSFGLSPNGLRLLLEARGEILTIPTEEGESIDLSRSSDSREKNPAWSPDGKWVAFVSDRSGEEEIYLVDPTAPGGEGRWRQLTQDGKGFRMHLAWSPDSKWLLCSDKFMRLNLVEIETGAIRVIAQGEYDDGWERWGIQDYVWSPDNRWIAYTRMEENLNETIHLYSTEAKKSFAVTSDWHQSWSPSFDPTGKYLYFLSNRTFNPTMGALEQNVVFLNMCRPYVVVLKAGAPSPFLPQEGMDKPEKEDEEKEKEKKAKDATPTVVDTDGLERRTVAVEGVPAGNYFRLEATEKGIVFLKKDKLEFTKYQVVTDFTSAMLDLYEYDISAKSDERKPKKLIEGINNYHLSADGKKLVFRSEGKCGVVEVGKEAKVGDGEIDLAKVKFKVDRRAEYLQMFNEAWRVQRDWFYDAGLHGVDWNAIGELYRKFIPFCGNRSDLTYLIGEMIGELNAGHTYVSGGDDQIAPKKIGTGLLGADFDAPPGSDYLRFAHIVPGVNWDDKYRTPLAAPDCPIKEGDYLIAVDGDEVRATDNVFRFLENKAEKMVRLSFNTRPSREGARTCRVKTLADEIDLRRRAWVEGNREKVDAASERRIGYVHLSDMQEKGLIEFARQYYPQHARQAILIDERYNGGGFVGDMIIDRLERKLWSLTQAREGKVVRNPEGTFYGHLVVLMNEDTGSNGEYFARAIQIKGLAELIGMRTWGGAIGIEPHQPLVDGGSITPPQFAPYGLNGEWLIEGHGVDPDMEVQNMPGDVLRGRDAQLEAGIGYLMNKLEKQPMKLPPTPAFPRKSK
jgi:tricorn protease